MGVLRRGVPAFPDPSVLAKAAISAATAALITVVKAVITFTEDHSNGPALLKAPPSIGENPVP